MVERFEQLTTGVSRIYKNIQKIKKYHMSSFGLKSTHVMCIYYLDSCPEGLTASELCRMCGEDKAGISRILSELEQQDFLYYKVQGEGKKYRAKALLTPEGKKYAVKINDLILKAVLDAGEGITEEDRAVFYRVLSVISNNLDQICSQLDHLENIKKGNSHHA